MSGTNSNHQLHSLPILCNMFMLRLLKVHDLISREIILEGGKYLAIKASLHLSHESILFRGKDENQVLARSLSEKGNNFNFIVSLSISFFFCISHNSTKVFRWDASSSSGFPDNCSFL